MEYTGCKKDVFDLIEEGTERFAPRFVQDKHRVEDMDKICELVDWFVRSQQCESVDVDVDEGSLRLTISIVFFDAILQRLASRPFYDLIQLLDSFGFEKAGDNYVCMKLNVDGLWEEID